jgi:hypothetical protein
MLEPWKQHLITGGAVILPTLVAIALFVFWRQWLRHRNYPVVRLFMLWRIAPEIVGIVKAQSLDLQNLRQKQNSTGSDRIFSHRHANGPPP